MILDNFQDIIKHTGGLGFIEMVKLTGDSTEVKVEAMDNDRSVVLYGTLKNPIDGLEGVIGLGRLGVLSGYLNFDAFSEDGAKVSIVTQEKNGEQIPTEICFDSDKGHVASYRFMGSAIAEEHIKVPPFKGVTWDVVVTPTKSSLKDLNAMNSILGQFESTFSVKTSGDKLFFSIGSGASDRTKLVFADGIVGELKHQWSWPLAQALAILKLHDTSASCEMSFSDQGALKIEIDSGLGVYEYILPARAE